MACVLHVLLVMVILPGVSVESPKKCGEIENLRRFDTHTTGLGLGRRWWRRGEINTTSCPWNLLLFVVHPHPQWLAKFTGIRYACTNTRFRNNGAYDNNLTVFREETRLHRKHFYNSSCGIWPWLNWTPVSSSAKGCVVFRFLDIMSYFFFDFPNINLVVTMDRMFPHAS